MQRPRIITIGLSPCWDVTCWSSLFEWDQHQPIERQEIEPAGKALNVSRALSWLNVDNIAAGFWGDADYDSMLNFIEQNTPSLQTAFTPVPGRTRLNITLVEHRRAREMHLRAPSSLATHQAFSDLQQDLTELINDDAICVFSGSMPDDLFLKEILDLVRFCQNRNAKVIIDTSGPALAAILELGNIWAVKPNTRELGELMGIELNEEPVSSQDFREVLEGRVVDKTPEILEYAQELLPLVHNVIVSRGSRGALAVSAKGNFLARCVSRERTVLSTVACGDYFLAGFLAGFSHQQNLAQALAGAVKAGTIKAWSLEHQPWDQVETSVAVEVTPVPNIDS